MLKHLKRIGQISPLLVAFAPLLLDDMSTVISRWADTIPAIGPLHGSSFVERLGYYRQLCHTGHPDKALQGARVRNHSQLFYET